ncbi:MAG: hypothetical protein PHQ35_07445 [Phycisphaerae bacterium]|nr:hypothetical protein [Phycisphaerae bacterium]MDD5380964.1 hypothetical protein [Phycisphaerae bacterium]
MGGMKDYPVWEVYDLYRDCRLNTKYWSKKLIRSHRFNLAFEYLIMVTAPGSAVAGLFFWQTSPGAVIWKVLIAITALLSIAKPLLKLSDRVANLQGIVTQYRSLDHQLEQLSNDIRRDECYSVAMVSTFKNIARQEEKVSVSEPIEDIDSKLQKACFDQVNRELPEENFYIPTKSSI